MLFSLRASPIVRGQICSGLGDSLGRLRIVDRCGHSIQIRCSACELRFRHVDLGWAHIAFALTTISPSAAPSAPPPSSLALAIRLCGELGARRTTGVSRCRLDKLAAGIVLVRRCIGRRLR